MVALVDLDQVKTRLNITDYPTDTDLMSMILEVSAVVLDYLKPESNDRIPANLWQNSSGYPEDVPLVIQSAVLIGIRNLEQGEDILSQGVMDILHRYRDPALA